MRRPGSSVGIATELRAGRSGIESQWRRDFSPIKIDPGAHPASCTMGTGSFLGVKCSRGVLLTTHPLLLPRSWRVELYLHPLGHTGPETGTLYLFYIKMHGAKNIKSSSHASKLNLCKNYAAFPDKFKKKCLELECLMTLCSYGRYRIVTV